MPSYLYACQCGDSIEIKHLITEDPVINCALCDQPMTRRVVTVGYEFKGSGFYSTEKREK